MHPLPPAIWCGQEGVSPVLSVAVHAGHELRPELADAMVLAEPARLREEDPGTGFWASRVVPTWLVAQRSRFEVDLNRPREAAVYVRPEQCWGLEVWGHPLGPGHVRRSLAVYDAFYAALAGIVDRAVAQFGHFVLYDVHSYNHRRDGPEAAPADPAENPDINLGTGSMDRDRWAPVVERFLADLRAVRLPSLGRRLDVRENVRFRGGHLAQWIHDRYPRTGCALAVEVKKFFMDEHTGMVDEPVFQDVGDALAGTVPGVVAELERSVP